MKQVRAGNYTGPCVECGSKSIAWGIRLDEDGLPEDKSILDKMYCWRCKEALGKDGAGNDRAGDSPFIPGSLRRLATAERKIRKAIASTVRYYNQTQAQAMLAEGKVTHISKCRLAGTMLPPDSVC